MVYFRGIITKWPYFRLVKYYILIYFTHIYIYYYIYIYIIIYIYRKLSRVDGGWSVSRADRRAPQDPQGKPIPRRPFRPFRPCRNGLRWSPSRFRRGTQWILVVIHPDFWVKVMSQVMSVSDPPRIFIPYPRLWENSSFLLTWLCNSWCLTSWSGIFSWWDIHRSSSIPLW